MDIEAVRQKRLINIHASVFAGLSVIFALGTEIRNAYAEKQILIAEGLGEMLERIPICHGN